MVRKHFIGWTSRAVLATVAALSLASAQDRSRSRPASRNNQPVELGETKEVELTPKQMKRAVPGLLAKVRSANKRVRGMLRGAREAGDVSKVLCLDPLAGEIQIATGAAADRGTEFSDALDRGDVTRAKFSFNLLTVVGDRVQMVAGQAGSCIGEEAGFAGDSAVEVEIDPTLPDPDTSETSDVPVIVTAEPNVESATE